MQTSTGLPAPENPRDASTTAKTPKLSNNTLGMILGSLFYFLHALGAAKLAYDHYSSLLLAVIAFIFAPFFYMFYAFAVGGKVETPLIMGGRRRRH
jgi:hypothetical protein